MGTSGKLITRQADVHEKPTKRCAVLPTNADNDTIVTWLKHLYMLTALMQAINIENHSNDSCVTIGSTLTQLTMQRAIL